VYASLLLLNLYWENKINSYEMKHKNFRAIYTNRDENFYAEFHVANKKQ